MQNGIIGRTIVFSKDNAKIEAVVIDKCLNGYNQTASGTLYLVESMGSVMTVLPNMIKEIKPINVSPFIDPAPGKSIMEKQLASWSPDPNQQSNISTILSEQDDDLPF